MLSIVDFDVVVYYRRDINDLSPGCDLVRGTSCSMTLAYLMLCTEYNRTIDLAGTRRHGCEAAA